MKFNLLCFVAIALAPFGVFAQTPDDIGLMVLANEGFVPTDGSYCTLDEYERVHADLVTALFGGRRNLRQAERKLVNCNVVCQGFPTGQCFLVYRMCPNRRELEDADSVMEVVDEINDEGRDLATQWRKYDGKWVDMSNAPLSVYDQCDQEKKKFRAEMMALLSTNELSSPCTLFLSKAFKLECVVMN